MALVTAPLGMYDLPQELRDIIFPLAYSHPKGPKIVFKSAWEGRKTFKRVRRSKKHLKHNKRPFPPLKVDEWLVSKRYFRDAAEAWMAAKTLHENGWNFPLETNSHQYLRRSGLFVEFARTLVIQVPAYASFSFHSLANCPSIQSLSISVSEFAFEDGEGQSLRLNRLEDKQLMSVLEVSGLCALRGLKEFHLGVSCSPNALSEVLTSKTPGEPDFQANIRRLNSMARTFVLEERADEDFIPDANSLYHGSWVCNGTPATGFNSKSLKTLPPTAKE